MLDKSPNAGRAPANAPAAPTIQPPLPPRPLPPAPTPAFAALLAAGEITPQEWIGRVRLAATCRMIARMGWEEPLCTQVSLRVPGGRGPVFLVPAYGVPLGSVGVADIVRVSLDGRALSPLAGERPDGAVVSVDLAGFRPHAAIYGARGDVHCVTRIHTPAAVSVACQGEGLRMDNPWGSQLAGRVASHDFGGIDFDAEECNRIASDLGTREVLILRSHGFIAVGAGLEAAWRTLSTLQRACETQVGTESMSGANEPLTPTMARRCAETFAAVDARTIDLVFDLALGRVGVTLAEVLPGA